VPDNPNPPAISPGNVALPGPHPHESADFRKWAGRGDDGQPTLGLPAGVEPYQAPAGEDGPEPSTV
jgi:hypothetical protein